MTNDASSPGIFSPLRIGRLELPGRLIKTATSETRAGPAGHVTNALLDHYRPLAAAGTPLIITGNIYVSTGGQSTPLQMGADHDDKIAGLAGLVDAVHAEGGLIMAQLSHCGRQVLPRSIGADDVVSASGIKDLVTGTQPRALAPVEIASIVRDFGQAARRCVKAGFDGIQIHAGHGYLISQFLTPHTNRRSDQYGGSAENHGRFLREVYRTIRDAAGPECTVIMKINGSDYLPLRRGLKTSQLVDVAVRLQQEGLDGVEVSVGHYESGYPMVRGSFHRGFREMSRGSVKYLPTARRLFLTYLWPVAALACNLIWPAREGFNLQYAAAFTKALSIPVICVGGFLTREPMDAAIASGQCDAISAGRGFIANPFLYQHLREGTPGPVCVDCNACVGTIGTRPLDCYHPKVRAQKDRLPTRKSD